ncbi:MAG: cytochrome C peroxidase, partial [Phaeodactylibacter sp.]|nr:cytochrome C peroxidase [Phaeodactylibacter sp.]
ELGGPFRYADNGRGAVTGVKYDNGRFRVPALRNVTLTAPYMHDGRFVTLEEVIDHYDSGGHPGTNVDPKIRKLHLSDEDKAALAAFLGTLTDTSFVRKLSIQKAYLQ